MRNIFFRGLGSLGLALTSIAADQNPKLNSQPNIIFILADDMGYSDVGCYGGEIRTPVLDHLAENGIRFTQFYSAARCWPSRAALMTGFYPQQTNTDPPKSGVSMPSYVRLLPAYLKPNGYRCYHSGKWHVRPGVDKVVEKGGFDRSYHVTDYNRYFTPRSAELDDKRIVPKLHPDFYTTTETVNYALDFLGQHQAQFSEQPFFLYLAFVSPHFPLQAPEEDIAKYRELYEVGWDQIRESRYDRMQSMGLVNGPLSARMPDFKNWGASLSTEELKAVIGSGETATNTYWNSLTDEEKVFQAEKMAIHAAMVDRMDQEIGRLVSWLESTGELDNTLIFFASDNGASSEQIIRADGHDPSASPGSAGSFLCLGPGWACTANTPFRYSKGYVHEGGIASPLIVHWPAEIKDKGGIRHTQGHLIDILPTLADVAGGIPKGLRLSDAPPLPGRSLRAAFCADVEVDRKELFFSHMGNCAIRQGDWKAVKVNGGSWELYQTAQDRAETVNLFQSSPERLATMIYQWQTLNHDFSAQAATALSTDSQIEQRVENNFKKLEKNGQEYVFSGQEHEVLPDTPALTMQNDIIWHMEVNIDITCAPGAILLGNRITPQRKTTFFKITPSRGVQLFKDGRLMFKIPMEIPRERWVAVTVVKSGPKFVVYLDGKSVGSVHLTEPVVSVPCYLGGDPRVNEFATCSIRNAAVEAADFVSNR